MLAAALRAEAASFVASFTDERLPDGRQRVVHHGTGPERMIQTGIGAMPVQRHKVRDRATDLPAEKKIRFTSTILPRWARRSRSLDALLAMLYLRGVSTGDFQEALAALLGPDAPNLSPGVISRLTAGWQQDYDRWQRRDLSARSHVVRPLSRTVVHRARTDGAATDDRSRAHLMPTGSPCRPGWSRRPSACWS
jgi:hypothetical protein